MSVGMYRRWARGKAKEIEAAASRAEQKRLIAEIVRKHDASAAALKKMIAGKPIGLCNCIRGSARSSYP